MRHSPLFKKLSRLSERPAPFSTYTADVLWTDEHVSQEMLGYHLNPSVDLASRKQEFIDRSAAWMVERFDLAQGAAVLDLGCGPGLYTSRLAAAGAHVTGVDFSKGSLEHARSEAARLDLEIDYVQADYLRYETSAKFDLVSLIFCDFCALSQDRRAALLHRVRGLLKSRGALFMDVCSLAAFGRWKESTAFGRRFMSGFWSESDYFGFRISFKYEAERVTLDKYVVVEPARTWEVYNWLQYFDVESLECELRSAGFRIEEVYSDVAGATYDERADQFAVVAVEGQ